MSTHPTLRDELASRRAKKRELDRRAQRAARERNRDRIAALEATVEALKQQKSNSVVAGLMEQLNAVTKERNDLAKTLSLIETTLQVHRSGEKTKTSADPQSSSSSGRHDWPPDQPVGGVVMTEDTQAAELAENSQHPDISMPLTSPESWEITSLDPSVMAPTHGLLDGLLALDPFTPGGHGAFDITHLDHDRVIVPSPKHMCDCALPHDIHRDYSPSTPRSIWRMANEVLGSRQSVCEDTLRREGMESEDLAVRIVLKGWDEVEASCELTPFWKQLRRIDELQFRICGPTERLAILRTMHRILCHQAEETVRLPAWLQRRWVSVPVLLLCRLQYTNQVLMSCRPSQALPHSSAIDFFVWYPSYLFS